MPALPFGLLVFSALCLAIKPLRLYGVSGLAILSILYPLVILALAAAALLLLVLLFVLFRIYPNRLYPNPLKEFCHVLSDHFIRFFHLSS